MLLRSPSLNSGVIMAVFHFTGTLLVSMLKFIINVIIGATEVIHSFKNLTGISSSPVALESDMDIINFEMLLMSVCFSSNSGMLGRGSKFSSICDSPMLSAKLVPMVEKKSFSSLTISKGSVLSFIEFILLLGLAFCSNLLRAFHNFAESLPASCIEFWKNNDLRFLFRLTVLFRSGCSLV